MIAKSKKPNPYPGPRPFESEESGIFFGREREVSELVSLITAHRTVLLYAQSGAGKTSLLNAGVIPLLTKEDFEVLPVARVRGFELKDIDFKEIPNIYVFNTLVGWAGDNVKPRSLVSTSIGTFLKEREHLVDEQGLPLPRVTIFDQFEELFTSYPGRWEEREDFFRQVAEALEADPLLRVLFVIREDYLASLDSYLHLLHERLRTRYRLERLRADSACQAVERPLRDTGRKFAEGVALSLVYKLLNIRVENAAGEIVEVPGEYVEPVQLQVVCQSLWINLPRDVTEITSDHLEEFGDVQEALRSFYKKAIKTAKREKGVSERDLRQWFNEKLITPAGTRGTVFRGKEQTEGIPNSAVDVLEAQHIIRAEIRAGARWYELTHDRFIEPIRKYNADKQTGSLRRFLRLATAAILVMLLTTGIFAYRNYSSALIQKVQSLMRLMSRKSLLTVETADGGSVRKDPNKPRYYRGERVTLEATADPKYVFVGWSGDLSGSTNPTTLVMDADKTVTANFAHSLTVKAFGGSVTIDPNKVRYQHGETVILEAIPDTGYSFAYWSGDLSGSTNPTTLVMDANMSVTASFALKTYGLTTTAINGYVTKDPDKASYYHGETVTLKAVANEGYRFTNWSGDLSDSNNPAELVMDADKSVKANFVLKKDSVKGYNLTVDADGGSVTESPDKTSYEHGEEVTLEAVPDPGYSFTNWSGDLSDGNNPATLEMDSDKSVKAHFVKTYSLISTAGAGGAISPAGVVSVKSEADQSFTITPKDGYQIDDVLVDGISVGARAIYTFINVTADHTIAANFALKTYRLTAIAADGRVNRNPDQRLYNHGETVVLEAIPNTGYSFTNWSGDLSDSDNPVKLVMNADKTVNASFALKTYSLTATGVDGSVTIDPNKVRYNHGETVILTAVPDPNYRFVGWSDDLSGSAKHATLEMDADKSVTANFGPNVVPNSIGMNLVYIPAGEFMMGSGDSAAQLNSDYRGYVGYGPEFPQHKVRISEDFWMGQTEVTQGQYESVMNAQPWSGKPSVQEDPNNPAVYVSWYNAVDFCRKLSQREGETYRLPTEAEWEYACRAGTTTRFSFGDSGSSICDYAWYKRNSWDEGQKYAHPVGQKKSNPWGLYDMHGNVREWCSDYYDDDYYSNSPSVDPKGPSTSYYRSLRNGSWDIRERYLRCAYRTGYKPDLRNHYFGFRVVRSQ
jgi:uncharacterized repeat protein (TIGR02543 family)